MKNYLKLLTSLTLALTASVAFGQAVVESTFVEGNTGTTSATVIVKPGSGAAEVSDIAYRLDTGTTSATVDIRTGKNRVQPNSATSGSGSVLWFDNNPTLVSAQDYVIFNDVSGKTFELLKCTASASTSITVQETISVATATDDYIFPLNSRVRRPAPPVNSTTAGNKASIWLPAGLPSAITLDGNTTSCQISISGTRGNSK
jgi:hypothetical protein